MKETNFKAWAGVIALTFAYITPPAAASPTLTVLHKFGGTSADDPDSLIQASDGNFYGTTYLGDSTVFEVTASGQFKLLFTAPYKPNGTNHYPDGNTYTSIVEGPDGFLYVVGSTIFKISKSGAHFQLLEVGGAYGLSLASDGNFYGSDANGIFRLTTNGTFTYLSSASSNGFYVESFNKQATDGNFYGICYNDPVPGWWHVCQVTTSGKVTPIFEYATGSNARYPPNGILTQGSDGLLYGVAAGGPGFTAFQVIFQLSTSGSYQELYQIGGCTPKTGCSMALQASDGNLWIADPPQESVYSITTGGVLLQTVSFSGVGHPQRLIQASSGILYGTTGEPDPSYGDAGTVFSLNAGLPPPQ
jgi:hypothetical protein